MWFFNSSIGQDRRWSPIISAVMAWTCAAPFENLMSNLWYTSIPNSTDHNRNSQILLPLEKLPTLLPWLIDVWIANAWGTKYIWGHIFLSPDDMIIPLYSMFHSIHQLPAPLEIDWKFNSYLHFQCPQMSISCHLMFTLLLHFHFSAKFTKEREISSCCSSYFRPLTSEMLLIHYPFFS